MHVFQKEFGYAYGTSYAFGYSSWATLAADEEPTQAYERGFLPYSGNPQIQDTFYMARSVRIPLTAWTPTSENRRVLRKFDDVCTSEYLDRATFETDAAFHECFLTYFATLHGSDVMSAARLTSILTTPLPLRVRRYSKDGTPIAYVLEVATGPMVHYWFSCYTSEYAHTSLGMWLMSDAARRAQEETRTHLYLGTAYGAKGTYKMNLTPSEFWDGSVWNSDEATLKRYIKDDATRTIPFPDRFNEP